ncbi:MAG: ABC transporter permease [Dehalococcoidales bacterium]|nr:ABC transporter permease [Dehalococcoidales bacterium]
MVTATPNIQSKTKVGTALTRRFRVMRSLTLIVPVTVLALLVITAIFAPLLAPYDPVKVSLLERRIPPFFQEGGSMNHPLGTDNLGRDIMSRAIYGARISLSVSLLVIAITAAVGTLLGITAGYLGGRTEGFIMRVTDVSMAFPGLLIAMLLAVILGPSIMTVVLALSMLGWAPYARLIRGEALRLRESDFVAQARVNGASPMRIMLRHIFPNVINPLIIVMTMAIGMMILAEAALSYLGVGVPPPDASWGNMVADGRNDIDRAWWISTFPGLLIGLVVMSGNFFGDWLRDKMDPRLRQL